MLVRFINSIIHKIYLRRYMKRAGRALLKNREKDFYDMIKKDMAGYCVEIEDNLVTYKEIFKE